MLTAVIAHTSRLERAIALQRRTHANHIFVDDGTLGPTGNHRRALQWATEPLIVLEDDAVPTPHFLSLTRLWIQRFPDRLMSFYLGTSRPPTDQPHIDRLTAEADARGADYIEYDRLLHGVCYYVPEPQRLLPILNVNLAADYGVGRAWTDTTGVPVIYPLESLVDHADDNSLQQSDGQPRRARRLAH